MFRSWSTLGTTASPVDMDDNIDESADETTSTHPDRVDLVNGLIAFLQQSEATARTLRVECLYISSRGLRRWFDSFPSLTDLTLEKVSVDDRLPRPPTRHIVSNFQRLRSLRLFGMLGDFSYEEVCNDFARGFHAPSSLGSNNLKALMLELDLNRLQEYHNLPESGLRGAAVRLRMLGVDVYVR